MNELISILKSSMGDCKRIESSKCLNKTSYEVLNSPIFFIIDEKDNEPVKIVAEDNDYYLTVRNHNHENICFVKTDKCLFETDHKKCDCIFFNRNKLFFVEISSTKSGNRNRKRNDAVKQLGSTIEKFRESNIDLTSKDKKAVICFKNGQTRPTQPSSNSKRAVFLSMYNISLEEGNEIIL